MKLLKIAWRNICSYGNKLQEFTFSDTPELILVEGKNGSGKSSIKEALTISLYGKSAVRKTKDIPNRINKNAYTCIDFLSSSGNSIRLERGIDPNYTNLTIDNSAHNLPDKRKVDSFVEEELIDFPFSVFSNTISLSFEDFKSFIKLTPTDKRKIIDRIFGTDVLTEMSNHVKEDSRENKSNILFIESDIESNRETLSKSKEQLDILKNSITKENTEEISSNLKQIEIKNTEVSSYKKTISSITSETVSLKAKLQSLNTTYSKNNAALAEIAKKLEIYELSKCPHCLSDLTDSDHNEIKTAILEKQDIFNKRVPNLESEIDDLRSKLKESESIGQVHTLEMSKLNLDIINLQESIENLKAKDVSKQTSALSNIISNIEQKISVSNESPITNIFLLEIFRFVLVKN